MASITQDMRFCLSLIKYAQRFGVTALKYKINRQYIYRWKKGYDGSGTNPDTLTIIPIHMHRKRAN